MTSASNLADVAPDTSATDPASLVGQVIADRFRIDELLGEGGMGAVYRAFHTRIKKTVALKILRPELTTKEDVVARFEREAVAAGRIEHENVAKATDFGRLPDGSFYLALEFVRGKSLSQVIAEGPVSPERTLGIVRQIACGIDAAHQVGIVHRDLKPDNIMMVERDGAVDVVKILDFGVAKLDLGTEGGTAFTKAGTIIGTPEYMAPEQAGGANIDGRADLYALGVITYEMLAGTPPFAAPDSVAVMTKHLTEPPPPLPVHVPVEVSTLVMDLLQKEPDQRPESATHVVERVDALGTPPPPSAISGAYAAVEAPPSSAFVVPPIPPSGPFLPMRESSRGSLIAMIVGALFLCVVLVGVVGWASTARSGSEPLRRSGMTMPGVTTPEITSEPAASAAPEVTPTLQSAEPAAGPASEPSAEPEAPAPVAPAGPAKPAATKPSTKKSTAKTKSAPPPKKKRKTGPGGIYIPPPSEWF
jgi:serine/threonine-protein kinase